MENQGLSRFQRYEKLINIISWSYFLFAFLSLVVGGIFLKAIYAAPQLILDSIEIILYVYIAYFVFLLARLFYFLVKIRPKRAQISVGRTVTGIIISPIGVVMLYLGLLMMAMSSCSA